MEILKTILSVTGISVVLAVLIIIAEKFLNNYGECKIDINDGEKELTVDGGSSLLSSLATNKIFIPSACGGKATCGMCKVKVVDGAGPLLPTEEPYLSPEERKDGVRLSCQVKIKNDIKISVPEELFNIREYYATITRITEMTHDIKEYRFEFDEGEDIKFKAGQYMQIESKPYGKVKEKATRAYSAGSYPLLVEIFLIAPAMVSLAIRRNPLSNSFFPGLFPVRCPILSWISTSLSRASPGYTGILNWTGSSRPDNRFTSVMVKGPPAP